MTAQENEYVKGRIKGKSPRKAALDAKYSESMADNAKQKIERRPEIQAVLSAFATKLRKKIPAAKVIQRIAEGLDAKETKFFQKDGRVISKRDVVAWGERRAYAQLAAEFGAYHVPPSPDGDPSNNNIQVNVIFGDL